MNSILLQIKKDDNSFFCYLCINCIIRKFIIARYGEIFTLNVFYFTIILTKPPTLGILCLTAVRLVVVSNSVIQDFFSQLSYYPILFFEQVH